MATAKQRLTTIKQYNDNIKTTITNNKHIPKTIKHDKKTKHNKKQSTTQ